MNMINIDHHNREVVSFLLGLGFSEVEIQDGSISHFECASHHLDFYSLELISQIVLDRSATAAHAKKFNIGGKYSRGYFVEVPPHTDASDGWKYSGDILMQSDLDEIKKRIGDEEIRPYLETWIDNRETIYSSYNLIILGKKLGVAVSDITASFNVPTQMPGEISVDSLMQYESISLTDKLVPEETRELGLSVYLLTQDSDYWSRMGEGSAVAISDDGQFLTAKHCLFNEKDGRFKTGLSIYVDGVSYPVKSRNVIADPDRDLAKFRIPKIKTPHFLPLAKERPEDGAPVVVIGFPSNAVTTQNVRDRVERRYSFGTVISEPDEHWTWESSTCDPDNIPICSNAMVDYGNSGGAMIRDGQLVGITNKAYGKTFQHDPPTSMCGVDVVTHPFGSGF